MCKRRLPPKDVVWICSIVAYSQTIRSILPLFRLPWSVIILIFFIFIIQEENLRQIKNLKYPICFIWKGSVMLSKANVVTDLKNKYRTIRVWWQKQVIKFCRWPALLLFHGNFHTNHLFIVLSGVWERIFDKKNRR